MAALGLTACTSHSGRPAAAPTGPVAVPVPTAGSALVLSACRSLLATVPAELDSGVRRRPVSGDATRTAAWGSPPITLRCGVAPPDPALEPLVIDSLPFVTTTSGGVTTWTTSDRAVNVSVAVPSSYEEQIYDVQPLVPALKALPKGPAKPAA